MPLAKQKIDHQEKTAHILPKPNEETDISRRVGGDKYLCYRLTFTGLPRSTER